MLRICARNLKLSGTPAMANATYRRVIAGSKQLQRRAQGAGVLPDK